jgi:hypothetical protein
MIRGVGRWVGVLLAALTPFPARHGHLDRQPGTSIQAQEGLLCHAAVTGQILMAGRVTQKLIRFDTAVRAYRSAAQHHARGVVPG